MKVSLGLAQAHSNVDLSAQGVDQLIEKIGAQLGAVEGVVYYGPRYDGIVIAKVVSCVKHPDADNLSLCKIDDGSVIHDVARDENGHVQVVCGASNVREGLMVAWIPPGATVPSSLDKEPFVLESREIRGQVSNGMLASPSELAISGDHDGILEITENEVRPGQPFKELYSLDDVIIDIENKMFTHRPDCFGVLGVARELAGIQGKQFKSPDWYLNGIAELSADNNSGEELSVRVQAPVLVPRFMAVAMKNVKVGPSPAWLQACLTRVGIKPINNIVDATNYIMYVTGQPLHAYDNDKLPAKNNLIARTSLKGETVNLLNGKQLELQDDSTVVIASGDKVVGIGGIMGGKDTEVSESTANIIIECANFDMYNIRRSSMKYGLFTEAVTRFTKGQSVHQIPAVIGMAVKMIGELSSGKKFGKVADEHVELPASQPVQVSAEFINERLGSDLSREDIQILLRNVEFEVAEKGSTTMVVSAPFWRTDIEIAEDVVEEVGRLHGFDNLPLNLPSRPAKPSARNNMLDTKSKLRSILSAAGANELLSYSFVHENLLKSANQDVAQAFQISNALSPDLQYYRTSLTPSVLERVYPNLKLGFHDFALFELGTVHNKQLAAKEDGLPKELHVLSLVTCQSNTKLPAFYQARVYLDNIADRLGFKLSYRPITEESENPAVKPYEASRSALVSDVSSGEVLGIIGEFKQNTRKKLKLPVTTAGFEIGLIKLMSASKEGIYTKLSKYPSVQQDISLRVQAGTSYQEIHDILAEQLLHQPNTTASLKPLDIFQRQNDSEHKQLAFRLTIAHYDKTLKSEEVNSMLDAAAAVAEEKLGAERI